jgi:high-affinity nickel permease
MDTAAECRIHAAEFLVQAMCEPEREAHLTGMAKSWLRLAITAEHIQALTNHTRPILNVARQLRRPHSLGLFGLLSISGVVSLAACFGGVERGEHDSGKAQLHTSATRPK